MFRNLTILFLGFTPVFSQDPKSLPEKVQALQKNYDSAVARATAPLTKTYLQELQKMKSEFTRSGDLKSALAVEDLISQLSITPGVSGVDTVPLSEMTLDQFKKWLSGVRIIETTGFMNTYTFDGTNFISSKKDTDTLRKHGDAVIEVGRIFVPFTSTNATILIDRNLNKATVSYSTGGKIEASIRNKSKD